VDHNQILTHFTLDLEVITPTDLQLLIGLRSKARKTFMVGTLHGVRTGDKIAGP
jgi:hypothetical protein